MTIYPKPWSDHDIKEYPVDPAVQTLWKQFPLRISSESQCYTCKEDMILVHSRTGGYVTRNCPKCKHYENLSESDFKKLRLYVACPKCKKRMFAETLPYTLNANYGYVCHDCHLGIP